MTIDSQLTEDEQNRLNGYYWSSLRGRAEIVEVYEAILCEVEDEEIRESIKKLLKVMMSGIRETPITTYF